MSNVDWNLYRNQFPVRYWEQGNFDRVLNEKLKDNRYKVNSCLDVGCGTLGTLVLKDFSINYNVLVDMLDPYVAEKPKWMRNKINWDSKEKYDFIVARGSINYLNKEQFKKLINMLNTGGILIANTFLSAPTVEWSERKVENSIGEEGLEKSRLVGDIVEHQIIFKNYSVNHNFFYYTKENYEEFFKNVFFETYAKNSSLLMFTKRDEK